MDPSIIPRIDEQGGILGSIFLQDLQQQMAIRRSAYAEACGQPIPAQGSGINFTTVNNHPAPPTPQKNNSGLLKGALLGGALTAGLAGMGGVGYLASSLLNKPAEVHAVPAQPTQPVPVPQSFDSNVEMEVIPPEKQ